MIFTILIEFFIYSIIIRKEFRKLFLYSLLINSFTNPLANLFFNGTNWFLFIEIAVFIVEIFLIKYLLKINYWKAILISFVANLITSMVGLFLLLF